MQETDVFFTKIRTETDEKTSPMQSQVAQALDSNKVRNFFLGCWVTTGT